MKARASNGTVHSYGYRDYLYMDIKHLSKRAATNGSMPGARSLSLELLASAEFSLYTLSTLASVSAAGQSWFYRRRLPCHLHHHSAGMQTCHSR